MSSPWGTSRASRAPWPPEIARSARESLDPRFRWGTRDIVISMANIDFTLPDADGNPFTFDAAYREAVNPLLFFFRGFW